MAQTITARSGSTTIYSGGNSFTTLWTQSTGAATRVLLNSVSVKHPASGNPYGNLVMSLCINVGGSGNLACVALKSTSGPYADKTGMSMMPGSNYTPVGTVPGYVSSNYPDRWTQFYNGNSAYYLGARPQNNWYWSGPSNGNQAAATQPCDLVPSQFWINNGDSVVFVYYDSSGAQTCDVLYSFTTVTES
jgi:hypothetical protein